MRTITLVIRFSRCALHICWLSLRSSLAISDFSYSVLVVFLNFLAFANLLALSLQIFYLNWFLTCLCITSKSKGRKRITWETPKSQRLPAGRYHYCNQWHGLVWLGDFQMLIPTSAVSWLDSMIFFNPRRWAQKNPIVWNFLDEALIINLPKWYHYCNEMPAP